MCSIAIMSCTVMHAWAFQGSCSPSFHVTGVSIWDDGEGGVGGSIFRGGIKQNKKLSSPAEEVRSYDVRAAQWRKTSCRGEVSRGILGLRSLEFPAVVQILTWSEYQDDLESPSPALLVGFKVFFFQIIMKYFLLYYFTNKRGVLN